MKRNPLRSWLPYAFAAIVAPLIAAWPQRAQAQVYWDPLADGNSIIGGAGSWNLTNTFWDPLGTDLAVDNVAWPNLTTSQAIFGGTGGTVLMNQGGALTANSLTFNTGGYVINANAPADVLALGGTTPTITVTNSGQSAIINSIISSAGGIVTAGNGFLTLGGNNGAGLAGQVIVSPGTTLGLNNNAALGALGAGNETIVQSGGTLRVGGVQMGNLAPAAIQKIIRIAGTGVGGAGALINTRSGGNNTLGKVVLTADATLSAGGNNPISLNAAGSIVTSAGGRTDIRQNAAPTAGQAHLDLAGFTLTKTGGELLAIVNSEVTSGNIIVNGGILNIEVGSLLQGTGTVTVNPGAALGFWSVTAANVTRPIVLNGGTLGDPTSTGAAQAVNSPVSVTGALRPNFTAVSGNQTNLAGVISESAFTGGGFDKRGAGLLAFSNVANSFTVPITVRAGTLRGIYNTALPAGGVSPGAPLTSTDTPLGTNKNITLAGGTLSLLVNMANDGTQQVWSNPLNVTVDQAPGGMAFDRLSNTSQVDKMLKINSLMIAPASAANQYSIGQNQFTFSQGSTHRLDIPLLTINNDTLLNLGDFHISGIITSAGKNSIVHSGGNTIQFLSTSAMEHNALFNVNGTLRVGSGFGTPVVSNTATAGSGPIFVAPGQTAGFRSPTNMATGQVVELLSQQVNLALFNLEQNGVPAGTAAVPENLRALTTGVYGIGNATYGNLDVTKLGNGTFRIGSNIGGSGNGTVTGTVAAGAGSLFRVGGSGTTTFSGTNAFTGTAGLEVGAGLKLNATPSGSAGTAVLTKANDYSGGTTVNRGSTLSVQAANALGTGAVELFGNLSLNQAGGTLVSGAANTNAVNIRGGSTLTIDNGAVTGAANVDRWADTAAVALNASTITFNSRNDNASTTLEKIGNLSYAGGSVLNVNRQNAVAGNVMEVNVDSFVRSGTGTLEIARSSGTGAGFGVGQFVKATSAPSSIALSSGTMIAPHITVVDGTRLVNFATYGANGIDNAVPTNTVNTAAFTAGLTGGNQLVYVDFAAAALTSTLGDNPDVMALKVGAGISAATATTIANGTGTSIKIRSGGLIISGDTTAGFYSNGSGTQTTINPALNFNDGTSNVEALINVRGGTTGILNGVVTANGLTKFGGGTLNLTANNSTLAGTVSLNGGTLQAFGPTATGTYNVLGNGNVILNGGQLNLRSNNTAVTGTINPTLQNGLSIAADVPTATVDLNRSGADTASTGTFIFNPAASGPGLQLLGSPGAQGQTLNVSGANYGLQFGTNAVNSFAGNVTVNNAVTVTLNNAPTITGTNPVISKSGAGNLIVGAVGGAPSVAAGTRVVMNDGTLELRSITAFGTGTTTSLELNRGTLNLRRDSAGYYGGAAATAYNVTVNGNSTISADRASAGSGFVEGLGAVAVNGINTLTTSNGNGVVLELASLSLNGNGLLNIGSGSVTTQDSGTKITGAVTGGSMVRSGGGFFHLMSAASTYDGGTWLNGGTTRLRAAGAAGTGTVVLNPGATIDFNAANNLNAGQSLVVRSTTAFPSMISMNTDVAHPTTGVNTAAAPFGIVGLSNSPAGIYNTPINLSTLYGGGWSLGGVSNGAYDPTYTAATLGAGNGNLYRLGGGGTSFFLGVDSTGAARTNLLTGAGNSVRLGIDSGNILPVNGGNFQYVLGGNNNYGGNTIIHRGMAARLGSAAAGGFSGLSNTAIDLYGALHLSAGATLQDGGVSTNALTLHPGSTLTLDNNGGINGIITAANVADRIADSQALQLNGAALNLIGTNTVGSSETVGAVTYGRGARIRVGATGTGGTATLTLASLTRAGTGSSLLLQTSAAGTLGGVDKLMVTSAPTVTNGMVDPSITNGTDGHFVTYGGSGFANAAYDNTFTAAGTLTAGMASTAKVSIASAGSLTLGDNPDIYALRTDRDVLNGGPFNQIQLRSGGLIGATNALTIQPNLIFNDGTSNVEAKITALSTINLNGAITAAGVTKSGSGALVINVPQTAYASGWTVNSGDLQFNDLEAAGQSVAGNAITVNATQTTGGINASTLTGARVIFNRDMGTSEVFTFTGGPITVVNDGAIRIAGGDNRNLMVPGITTISSGTGSTAALTLDVPNNRFRGITSSLTLGSDTTLRVLDSGSTADTGRITAAVVNSLVGTNKNLLKLGNRTLELGGDNSATFTGGSIVNSQGTLRVLHNGALGSATTAVTIERNATLEIGKANFVPTATVTQLAGSIERWNQEDARGTTYNLPAGVNLQLNTNLQAARTIGLNGGTIEGFIYADHVAQAALRTVGSAVTLNLLSDSYVGQGNVIGGQNYDAGRLPTVGQPFGDTYTGSPLMINGAITGAFNLTKTGLDTVTIAGTSNTYRNTIVDMGTLRIGADNALPTAGALTPRLGGIVDLYGSTQSVAGLGYATAGPNPGGVSLGSAGRVTNSGTVDKVLNVNNSGDYTYNGTIDLNVALTKSGAGRQVLGGTNTYRGPTSVSAGTLLINGDNSGANGAINVASGATLGGSGILGGALTVDNGGIFAPGNSPGTLTTTTSASFSNASVLNYEFLGTDTSVGGVNNDLFTGVINLTLDGVLNVNETAAGSFLSASLGDMWRIIDYTGTLTDNTLNLGSVPALSGGNVFAISTATTGQVNLVVVPETSSVGLLGLTALLTLRRRRRAA